MRALGILVLIALLAGIIAAAVLLVTDKPARTPASGARSRAAPGSGPETSRTSSSEQHAVAAAESGCGSAAAHGVAPPSTAAPVRAVARRRRSPRGAPRHQPLEEGEVVEVEQPHRGQLLGPDEVVDVGAVVAPRRSGTGSPRPAARGPRRSRALARSKRKRDSGQRGERHAVAGEAGRHRAVEDVDAEAIPASRSSALADPEQVLGRLGRAASARSSPAPRASPPCRGRACRRSPARRRPPR